MKSFMYSLPDINCSDRIEGVGQGKLHTHTQDRNQIRKQNTRRKEIISKVKAFVRG